MQNIKFFFLLIKRVFVPTLCLWLYCLLLSISGDIHPNPGPSASDSSSSLESHTDLSLDMTHFINSSHNLSIVHYNVQSLLHKLDLLTAELRSFDIITFSETWLSESISNEQLFIPGFSLPVRRDRTHDPHGGVAVYVKDGINFTRRPDLEITNLEAIWLEVRPHSNKRILIGTFYRPPNSDNNYFSKIEDSIGLAIEAGINDIIVSGDFNL